jgi:hypothetical protein
MARTRPFTLIAAIVFGLMALAHAYRLITHFQIVVGTHAIPMAASWIALAVTGLLAAMLYKESRG